MLQCKKGRATALDGQALLSPIAFSLAPDCLLHIERIGTLGHGTRIDAS
jgi:hypothetical protein